MNVADEEQGPDHLVGRLEVRFPSLPTSHIRRVIDAQRSYLERGTIGGVGAQMLEEAVIEELRKDADPVRLRE